ncbi:MAG: hypothetical protein K0R99_916 [Microbacterium sp.]|jgi:DNA-binding transcriptional regulator YiaG|uniref:helix-turn-helix domain-containing protein n=1 Tax=Microbacterium sp. TaxID=51671 RepID=UPI00262B6C40|nr:helix-turn-helix domain-containing protein [Microbacterium sp.]MDF2559470.1 hypothetical protein [Microbacterium sp.]
MSETTTTEPTQEELEQRLEAVMLANLREEMELAALYESMFGAEFKGLKQIRDELTMQESARRIARTAASVAQLARQLGINKSTVHRWNVGLKSDPEFERAEYRREIFERLEDLESREAADV